MTISERRMQTAIKKYNDLMYRLGVEHCTIGTKLSENTKQWNLRDMVSECQYQLECFYEEGHSCYDALHQLDGVRLTLDDLLDKNKFRRWKYMDDGVKECKAVMKALRQFINTYKKDIGDMECHSGHSSMWD